DQLPAVVAPEGPADGAPALRPRPRHCARSQGGVARHQPFRGPVRLEPKGLVVGARIRLGGAERARADTRDHRFPSWRPAAFSGSVRTASTPIVIATSSPSIVPPWPRGLFQTVPKSLGLMVVVASKPAR